MSNTRSKSKEEKRFKDGFKESRVKTKEKILEKKKKREERPFRHKSFRRSYREDYEHPLEIPGLLHHAMTTFKIIRKNWKLFLPLILLVAFLNIILVGIMTEDTYLEFQDTLDETTKDLQDGQISQVARAGMILISTVMTGGLSQGMSEVQQVFAVLILLITWLVTIYIVRHYLAGHKIKLRDALYNSLTPLISTFLVLIVVLMQLLPIFITIVIYSVAVATEFLSAPFYALLFFVFAALMILLSLYLLSSTFLALIAVTAPGLYPMVAIRTASDLVIGRRIKLIIRIIYLFLVLLIVWVVIMVPLILLDTWLKSIWPWLEGWPFVSLELLIMTIFSIIYFSTYSYLFYRRLLDYDD